MEQLNTWMLERYVALVARAEGEEGQALAEYGLLVALIAVVCIAAVTLLGGNIAAALGAAAAVI